MKPFERSSTANYSSKNMWKSVTGGILSTALLTSASFVNAQTEFKLGDDSGVTVGFGIRTSYTSTEKGAANGINRSNDFAVDQARLFLSGHYGKIVKGKRHLPW